MNDTNSSETYQCSGVTKEQLDLFHAISFWVSGIGQLVICIVGICINCIAIPVLRSKILYKSTFNRLLIILAIIDITYLFLAIAECIRQEMNVSLTFHIIMFVHFLYPLHNIVLCLYIFMTVVLAHERLMAISDPIDYHAVTVSNRQTQRVIKYVLPITLISVAFNMPKFFELRVEHFEEEMKASIRPTKLRLNDDYTVYYHNYARLFMTGLLPFLLLMKFNFQIYRSIRVRRQNMGGFANARNAHSQQFNEDKKQAIVLFAIVILFLICQLPRNFLSAHESINFAKKKEDYANGCRGMPLWILVIGMISHLFLTCNAAFNFILYTVMAEIFRKELWVLLKKWSNVIKSGCGYCKTEQETEESFEMVTVGAVTINQEDDV